MDKIAATVSNPFALVAFVIACVLGVVFVRSRQDRSFRWFALVLALVAVVGGLVVSSGPIKTNPGAPIAIPGSVNTTGDTSPVVIGTGGNVEINKTPQEKK